MKRFLFLSMLLFSVMVIFSCTETNNTELDNESVKIEKRFTSADKVGEVLPDGSFVITTNESDMKTRWDNVILSTLSGTERTNYVPIEIVEIVDQLDEVTSQPTGTILMMGYHVDSFNDIVAVSAVALTNVGGDLYERFTSDGGGTVTCSGCPLTGPNSSEACIPKLNENTQKYYCTACEVNGGNQCTKSVSQSTGDVLTP